MKRGGPAVRALGRIGGKRDFKAYLYLLPIFVILAVFVIYPLLMVLRMGFYEKYVFITDQGSGFGLAAFLHVLRDKVFLLALRNTLVIVFVGLPVTIALSLAAALLIHSVKRLKGFFQTVYFLPYVTATIAIGTVFRWLFHYDYGYLNYALGLFGIEPLKWLGDPKLAIIAVTLFTIWNGMAFKIVLFLAGLQKIDPQYYKAAQIDATPPRRVFFRITMPLLSPTFWMVTIVSAIHAFKTYTEVFAMFSRDSAGPANGAITIVWYIYDMFFNKGQVHYASAAALIFLAIVMALTFLQRFITRRYTHYGMGG